MKPDSLPNFLSRLPRFDVEPWLIPSLAAIGLLYLAVVLYMTGADGHYQLDAIAQFRIFGIDDAYRYFILRNAPFELDVLAWNYIEPVQPLLDGFISLVVGGSLALHRVVHAMVGLGTLFLAYRTGVALGLSSASLAAAVLTLGLMPIFMFVTLSFLGEAWLVFFFALACFLFVTDRWRWAAGLLGLLPLVRPEGLIVMLPFAFFFLFRRRWWLAGICVLPGFAYLLFLLTYLDDPTVYYQWRVQVRHFINAVAVPSLYNEYQLFSVFNVLWLGIAAVGFFLLRRWWPLWLGACLVWAVFYISVATGGSFFEPRYFVVLTPMLALAGARTMDAISAAYPGFRPLVLLAAGLIIIEHAGQIDMVRASAFEGRRWPLAGPPAEASIRLYTTSRELEGRRRQAERIHRIFETDHGLDTLFLNTHELFYDLRAEELGTSRIVYLPGNPEIAYQLMGGSFFGMFSGGRYYGYFNFSTLSAARMGLLVSKPFCDNCQTLYRDGERAMYVLSYTEGEEPVVVPDDAVRDDD